MISFKIAQIMWMQTEWIAREQEKNFNLLKIEYVFYLLDICKQFWFLQLKYFSNYMVMGYVVTKYIYISFQGNDVHVE